METKALIILGRYYARSFFKRSLGLFPFLLFLLSFGLFVLILFPRLLDRLQTSPILESRVRPLIVRGHISYSMISPKSGKAVTLPAGKALIESGGFRTVTEDDGSFELEFESRRRTSIPIVSRFRGRERIFRLDYPPETHALTREFLIK